jgi:hypothetical protein
MSYFLLIVLFIFPAFAGLEKIQLKNLDLHYLNPEGSGTVEQLNIGIGLPTKKENYPVSIFRKEGSFEIVSAFAHFEWLHPIAFIHDLQSLETQKLNLDILPSGHRLKAENLKFHSSKQNEFLFEDFTVTCRGQSLEKNVFSKLKEDCLNEMDVMIRHMDIPSQFLKTIAEQLPEAPADSDFPANDFYASVAKGNFFSFVRIKFVIPAYLKIWGYSQFEDHGKTIAIRVDEVKYGVLPVTAIVMNELKRLVTHPKVTINPPWVRIKLGKE